MEIKRAIARLSAAREEVRFAVLHGSFLEPRGFRDLDVAVRVDPQRVPPGSALEYEFGLSAEVERAVSLPADVKILNYAPLGFRYWVKGGVSPSL